MSSKHRPLLACTVSILAMAEIVSRKAQDLKGPLGSTYRTTAKLAILVMSPLICAMKYQWSVIVFFVDYQFLAIEKTIKHFCPSASHVFNKKIEGILLMIESMPEKFDDNIDKLPSIIYQFLFSIKQWSLVHLIYWLSCLISTLNRMKQEDSRIKEIDIDHHNRHNLQRLGPQSDSIYTIESFCSAVQSFPGENYKDMEKILERMDYEGASEREENDNSNIDRAKDSASTVKFRDIGKRVIMQEEHPILQLFESNWLAN